MLTSFKRLRAPLSLKSRFALTIGLLIALTTLILTSVSVLIVQRGVETVVLEREAALADRIARDIDQHFQLRQNLMLRLAADLAADLAAHPPASTEAGRQRMELYHSLGELFASLSIVDRDGRFIASMNNDGRSTVWRYSGRPYFDDTLRHGAPTVSEPVISEYSGRPFLMLTAPVRDAGGHITHVLVGTIDLARDSVLRQPAAGRDGAQSQLYIVSRAGRFISHPEAQRLGKHVDASEAAMAGIQAALGGTSEGTFRGSAHGREILLSYRRMPGTGWLVALSCPADDAFAFADTLKFNAATVAVVLLLVLGPAAWMLLDRALRPIEKLGRRLRAGGAGWCPEPAYPPHEIGELARVFDQLMAERAAAERAVAASEQMLRKLADNIPAMVAYVDREQRFVFGNRRYEAFFGVSGERLPGMTVREVLGPTVYEEAAPHIAAALRGEAVRFERCVVQQGQQRWDHGSYDPDIDAEGQVRGYFALVHDITPMKTAQLAVEASERRIRAITDNMPSAVSHLDREGRVRFANRRHELWVEVPAAQLYGQPIARFLSPSERETHEALFRRALEGETVRHAFERTLHGEPGHFEVNYLPQRQQDGQVEGVTIVLNDVTRAKQVEQHLRTLARFDALTGLPNRTQLGERMAQALARTGRTGRRMAVLYLDLDNFKQINDGYGHGGGDIVLKEFAQRLLGCVRESDTVGRLAGDEFVILLEHLHAERECVLVAQKIVKAMERPFDIDGVAKNVTTSIGIALPARGEDSVEGLLKRADAALYQAKGKGRNQFAMLALAEEGARAARRAGGPQPQGQNE
jgi:diguanylate cyclase (GGDEF)-like protein/PAS domain S-box-containing protein